MAARWAPLARRTAIASIAGAVVAVSALPAAAAHGHGKGTPPASPGKSGSAPGHSSNAPPSSPGKSASAPGHTGNNPGQSGQTPSTGGLGSVDPPGNNGTLKIHSTANDTATHNVPHPGCTFYIATFGFDANQTGTLTITEQRTGATLLQTHVTLNPQNFRGTGSTFDTALGPFDENNLNLLATPVDNANQGWQLRAETNSDGAPGGSKTGVFWLSHCSAPTGVKAATPKRPTPTSVSHPAVRVLGESFARSAGTRSQGGLPFTGGVIGLLLKIALAELALGVAMTVLGLRRKVSGAR